MIFNCFKRIGTDLVKFLNLSLTHKRSKKRSLIFYLGEINIFIVINQLVLNTIFFIFDFFCQNIISQIGVNVIFISTSNGNFSHIICHWFAFFNFTNLPNNNTPHLPSITNTTLGVEGFDMIGFDFNKNFVFYVLQLITVHQNHLPPLYQKSVVKNHLH